MDPKIVISVHEDIPHETGRLIDEGLGAANAEFAPVQDVERLSCFARSASGGIVGGAVGRTWGECCELQQLWVDREHRRQGIARRILHAFEAEAVSRGCKTLYLETFSFQTPALYRSEGYAVGLEIAGFPEGIVKYVMVKRVGD